MQQASRSGDQWKEGSWPPWQLVGAMKGFRQGQDLLSPHLLCSTSFSHKVGGTQLPYWRMQGIPRSCNPTG